MAKRTDGPKPPKPEVIRRINRRLDVPVQALGEPPTRTIARALAQQFMGEIIARLQSRQERRHS